MDYGSIHATVNPISPWETERTYRFDGDVFLIPKELLGYLPQRGDKFSVGGNAFICVEGPELNWSSVAVRETAWKWRAYFFVLDPLVNWSRMVWRRLVVTLAIWNLADLEEGEIPGFHNIARRWYRR